MLVRKRLVEALVGDVLERPACSWKAALLTRMSSRPNSFDRPARRPRWQNFGVLDVAGDEHAAPALGLDAALRLRGVLVLVEVERRRRRRLRARTAPRPRGRCRIAAGDDRGHALELAAAAVVGRQEPRRELEIGFAAGLRLVLRRQLVGLAPRSRLTDFVASSFLSSPFFAAALSRRSCSAWIRRCLRVVFAAAAADASALVGLRRVLTAPPRGRWADVPCERARMRHRCRRS